MSQSPAAPARARAGLLDGRALVLLGIVLAAFNLRTAVTSLTPLLDALGREFGFGAATAGVFGMLPPAAFAAFGLATPAIAHRVGLERTALLAMLLAAAGLGVRSLAGGVGGLMAGSIVALAGMGMGNVVLPPLVKRYFGDRIGAVSTLYITVLQFGTILPALVAVPMTALAGWRVSMGSWALVAVAAALPWVAVLLAERRKQSALARIHDAACVAGDEAPELVPAGLAGRAWRSPVAWGLALMFGMTSLVTYSLFTWLPMVLADAGASPAFGGAMVALFSTLGLASALGMPALAMRLRNPYPLVIASVTCHAMGLAGLWLAPLAMPIAWVALTGLGASTFPLALTLINLRSRTPRGSAALSGFMQGLGYALSCAGPLLFGVLHEASGGWAWPFALLLGALALLLLGGWLACTPRMVEDSWPTATLAGAPRVTPGPEA